MKSTSVLADYYSPAELSKMAELSCTRTISVAPEILLTPGMFCQPIDIGIDLKGDVIQDILDMEGYPLRSLQNAATYINTLLETGVHKIMIRMDAPPVYRSKARLLERQASIVQSLRMIFSSETLQIIVDPFSVALNPDKTWGVQSERKLDYVRTAELFSILTQCFAEAGADYILTLGRFEREADIAARTITAHGLNMRVSSFSTNTETTNAYVYARQQAYAVTGQKIPVSNYSEMVFRALLDIYEGSSLVIVKPAENLHVLDKIVTLLGSSESLDTFLRSDQVKTIITQANYLRESYDYILSDPQAFMSKARSVGVGSYTVSGTYYTDRQTLNRKGAAFLKSLLYERYVNAAAAITDHSEPLIIDRNVGWYFTN